MFSNVTVGAEVQTLVSTESLWGIDEPPAATSAQSSFTRVAGLEAPRVQMCLLTLLGPVLLKLLPGPGWV